jgi:hypothetical protein
MIGETMGTRRIVRAVVDVPEGIIPHEEEDKYQRHSQSENSHRVHLFTPEKIAKLVIFRGSDKNDVMSVIGNTTHSQPNRQGQTIM